MVLRCRGSKHVLLDVLTTRSSARDILRLLLLRFDCDPLFDPKLIVTDEDARHTPDLKAAVKAHLGVVLHTVEPNRHSNGSAEGTNSWLRQVVTKRCHDLGGWQYFRANLRNNVGDIGKEQAATPQEDLPGHCSPDEFIILPEAVQRQSVLRRSQKAAARCAERTQREARQPNLPPAGDFLYWDPAVSDNKHPDLHKYTGPYNFRPCQKDPPHPNCRVRVDTGRHVSTHRLKAEMQQVNHVRADVVSVPIGGAPLESALTDTVNVSRGHSPPAIAAPYRYGRDIAQQQVHRVQATPQSPVVGAPRSTLATTQPLTRPLRDIIPQHVAPVQPPPQPLTVDEKVRLLKQAHGGNHRGSRAMGRWLRARGVRWEGLPSNASDHCNRCPSCIRVTPDRRNQLAPYAIPWDTTSATSSWSLDYLSSQTAARSWC
jgi:hypothetical protein